VTEPEHAMLQLSMKAHCSHTPLNADGFGLAWYHPDIAVPGAFKDVTPAWNNPNLKQMARAIKSHCFFAHVRAASTGGVNYPNCHPFVYKNLSFMHNGTVPYFKQTKRAMLTRISERAFQLVQGTTDSEMMFAMFVTNYERLAGLSADNCNTYHQDVGAGLDDPYPYIADKEDHTYYLADAIKATLRQVHYLALQHEYNTGIQPKPEVELEENSADGAGENDPLPPTRAIGRLNLAVADGQSTCTTRYATSTPETAHSLYYTTGAKFECSKVTCPQVLAASSEPSSPIMRATARKANVVVVSSEPVAMGFKCEEVPVNHMVVTGPNSYFSLESC